MAKRRQITHVPDDAEVTPAPSQPSRRDRTTPNDPTDPVTVESLATELEDLKGQIAIMVEWLVVHGERLDLLEVERLKPN